MNRKTSYGIRALIIAGLFLLVYLTAFFLLADLRKNVSWIGFGFAVLAFLPAGTWKLMVLLEVALLAGAAIYTIVGATAAARMTELDKRGDKR